MTDSTTPSPATPASPTATTAITSTTASRAAVSGDPTFEEMYPFEGHFHEVGGHRLHYLDEGEGEPVVMVHGNPSWSFYYRELVKRLRPSYRTIVPDHIGCGLSDKPGDSRYEYSFRQHADDLDALLEHLEIREGITLIVHDWGGMIGTAWAARHPGRVKRLVVLNTAAFHLPASKPFPWQLQLARTPLGPALVQGLNAFCRGAARCCVTRTKMPKAVREAYLRPYDSWRNRIAVMRFVQDIPLRPRDRGYDLVTEVAASLEQFREVPTMIAWGMRDFVFDRHFLAEWERYLPEAKVHRFEDCGHYILEDASAEILDLVEQFLAKNPLSKTLLQAAPQGAAAE